MTSLEKEVKALIPWFRHLKGWKIKVDTTSDIYDQCEFDAIKKTATIFRKTADVSDRIYALHEVLHIAFVAAFRRPKPYSKQQINDREEDLIQDICAFIFLNTK